MEKKEEIHIDNMKEVASHSEEELKRNKSLDNTNIDQNSNANESIDGHPKKSISCRITKRGIIFIIVGALVVLGLIIALVVVFSNKKKGRGKSFTKWRTR